MADKYETFIASYLRLNGYFTVPNFIVHAGEDPTRISRGHVGNHTETDIIGLRMPYSTEVTGTLHIANDLLLVDGAKGRIDAVIAEVKSGNDNKPNRVWRDPVEARKVATYIARFVGLHDGPDLERVGNTLSTTFRLEDDKCRFRYVVFSNDPNEHYEGKGVTYITFNHVIAFIVKVRGESWIKTNIGVASAHGQWGDLLAQVFAIANKTEDSQEKRVSEIKTFLASPDDSNIGRALMRKWVKRLSALVPPSLLKKY